MVASARSEGLATAHSEAAFTDPVLNSTNSQGSAEERVHSVDEAPIDASVSVNARKGDRDALAALGRRGRQVRAERDRQRKAAIAREVVVATIADRRALLARAVAAVEASGVDEARRCTALVAAVKELNAMDDYERMAERIKQLEQALTNAAALGVDRTIRLTFNDSDEPSEAPCK